MEFSSLLGKTLVSIVVNDARDKITFTDSTGQVYVMYHDQDCCESVDIESIVGDFNDLLGTPLLMAEEAVSDEAPQDAVVEYPGESETWTFYKLATVKGYVDIRWYGSSNGYYSESVSFRAVERKNVYKLN
jgi:hypothetical protein